MVFATLYHCSLATKDVTPLYKTNDHLKTNSIYKLKFIDQSFANRYEAVAAGPSIPIIVEYVTHYLLHSLLNTSRELIW